MRRGPVHLDRFIVSAAVLGFAGVAAAYGLPDSMPLKALAVVVIAIVAAIAAAYGWALFRAPYEQRNALRAVAVELRGQLKTIGDGLAQADDRQRRLREARDLTGETCYVWELLPADGNLRIKDRNFTDCIIQGPAMATFVGESKFIHLTFGGNGGMESVLHEVPTSGPKQGIIAFINCTFTRGEFRRIGIYGSKDFLDMFRREVTII